MKSRRPWMVRPEHYQHCISVLFPTWLRERGGIAVYENVNFSSSFFGTISFIPMRYIAKDERFHDAPMRIGELPSVMQERADVIKLDDYDGDLVRALAEAFAEGEGEAHWCHHRRAPYHGTRESCDYCQGKFGK